MFEDDAVSSLVHSSPRASPLICLEKWFGFSTPSKIGPSGAVCLLFQLCSEFQIVLSMSILGCIFGLFGRCSRLLFCQFYCRFLPYCASTAALSSGAMWPHRRYVATYALCGHIGAMWPHTHYVATYALCGHIRAMWPHVAT